jgi:hypothetical protein
MNDEQFDALCEANSFGAVARGDFQLVPRALLKALVDAAVAAERKRIADFVRSNKYGIGNMCSQWTSDEVADDILGGQS